MILISGTEPDRTAILQFVSYLETVAKVLHIVVLVWLTAVSLAMVKKQGVRLRKLPRYAFAFIVALIIAVFVALAYGYLMALIGIQRSAIMLGFPESADFFRNTTEYRAANEKTLDAGFAQHLWIEAKALYVLNTEHRHWKSPKNHARMSINNKAGWNETKERGNS